MPQHIATWNPETQLWESEDVCLFSEQREPWSEPFPTSGIAVGGKLYPLPQSAHRIDANECSFLLPTPTKSDPKGMDCPTTEWARHSPNLAAVSFHFAEHVGTISLSIATGSGDAQSLASAPDGANLLPTPRATDGTKGGPKSAGFVGGSDVAVSCDGDVALLPTPTSQNAHDGLDDRSQRKCGGPSLLGAVAELLPTPMSRDHKGASQSDANRHSPNLSAIDVLLPTPTASDCTGGGQIPDRRVGHTSQLIDEVLTTSWGKYAPAIARWEHVTSTTAPAPTEPNKNGNPRLSAAFSEWLMGWPAGWVTAPEIGISRNDQLRIVGNGVVSLQAEAALRYLLSVSEVTA